MTATELQGDDVDEHTTDLGTAPRAPYSAGRGATRLADPTARTVPVPRRTAVDAAPSVFTTPGSSGQPPRGDQQPPRRWRKRKYLAVAAASGLAAVVLGIGVGAVGGSAGTAAAEQRADAATQRAERSEAAAADAKTQLTAAQQAAQDAVSAQERAESALDGAQTAATDAAAQVAELQQQLTAAQAAAKGAAKASGSGSGSGSTSRSSGTSGESAASTREAPVSSSTYFANCSAARAAGAAPVHAGDPGYSRKLDRDGDGVGCE